MRNKLTVLASVVEDCAIAARLGAGLSDKWRLACALVEWHHAGRIPLLKTTPGDHRPLHLRAFGRPFDLWQAPDSGKNEMLVFHEIFGQDVYELPLAFPPRVILDLGSFTGLSPLFFALRHPAAVVYCVEPDPDNFAALERNTRSVPSITRLPAAIAGESGERTFYRSATQTCGHSLYASIPGAVENTITVQCVTVNELVKKFDLPSIDILKFDVEGAETEVFADFPFAVPVRALVGELHLSQQDEQAFAERFRQRGYDVVLNRDPFLGLTMFRALLQG